MSQFQPPSQPQPEPPFGSAAAFGEQAPVQPEATGTAGTLSGTSGASAASHYEQPAANHQPPVPPSGAGYQQPFGQPEPQPQQPVGYAQYPGYTGQSGQPRDTGQPGQSGYGAQPYGAPAGPAGAGPYAPPTAMPATGPSLFEDPRRLGRLAWLSVAVFGGLIAVASVLDAIANFTMAGFYGGASTVLTGLAVLLKGISLAAVVITVGKLAIDFFVGAALDRRASADGGTATAGTSGAAGAAGTSGGPEAGWTGAPTDRS